MSEYYKCEGCADPQIKFYEAGHYCGECKEKEMERRDIRRERQKTLRHRTSLIATLESIAEKLERIERAINTFPVEKP